MFARGFAELNCTVSLSTVSYCGPNVFSVLQLLVDCGLGGGGGSEGGTEAVVAQHRVLIFCQLKSMLDIVEHDLLKPKLPSVTYLRLDGGVPAGLRHSIVSRSVGGGFIQISTVCCLLL